MTGEQRKANQDMAKALEVENSQVDMMVKIAALETQLNALKAKPGQAGPTNVVAAMMEGNLVSDEAVIERPPENVELKKKVRKKQKELNDLRKRWLTEGKAPNPSMKAVTKHFS